MLEWILLFMVAGGMGKIANSDGRSPLVWGFMTVLVGYGMAMYVPLPFIRMMLAGVAVFLFYIGYKIAVDKG